MADQQSALRTQIDEAPPMTAPRWIRDAIDGQWAGNDVDDKDAEEFSRELFEHLPLEAMVQSVARDGGHSLLFPKDFEKARAAVLAAVRALTSDPEVVTLTELYRNACRALDAAGVPYAAGGASLSLVDRIAWLTAQRPTAIDLHRVEAERDQARRDHAEASAAFAASVADASIERDKLAEERDHWMVMAQELWMTD